MPVRVIGMIGVAPPTSDATLHVLEGGLSEDQVHDAVRIASVIHAAAVGLES